MSTAELASSYAALILADDGVEITVRQISPSPMARCGLGGGSERYTPTTTTTTTTKTIMRQPLLLRASCANPALSQTKQF